MQIEQEMKTTHTGDVWSFMTQAMPLDYNNPKAPFYSEVEREFAPGQDWTVNDAKQHGCMRRHGRAQCRHVSMSKAVSN